MNTRNLPCPCGSGLKTKRCCYSPAKLASQVREEREAKEIARQVILADMMKSFEANPLTQAQQPEQ